MTEIQVAEFTVAIDRKEIKNLHLAVYPPNGKVKVSSPLNISDDAIRLAVISRLPWIRRQQKKYHQQTRQSIREYVGRESHYFLGQRYLLKLVEQDGTASVQILNKTTIALSIPPKTSRLKREVVFREWYRRELKKLIPSLITKWETEIGVR